MPIRRTRLKPRREWTKQEIRHLLGGWHVREFCRLCAIHERANRPPDQFEEDRELARQAWEELRDAILAEFVRLHPGERPQVWWLFDAPQPRREQESQGAYLARLDLLTDGERVALAVGAAQ